MNANKELNIPKVDLQGIQAAQSEPDEKHIISLDGKLILSSDPIMIGKNFRTMTNLRYGKGHPEGIRGMSKINSSIINSTYYKARSAIQFTKQNPSEEHILAQVYNSGLTASKVYENKSSVPVSDVFVFDTVNGAADDSTASRSKVITSPPNTFTLEIKTLFPSIGTRTNVDYAYLAYSTATGAGAWRLGVMFCSDGLLIAKASGTSEVGADIVKCNATAAWQIWRFQVTKTTVSTATCDVYLDGILQQANVDCDYETGTAVGGTISFTQYWQTTNYMSSEVGYIKIATGLGVIS